MSRLQTFLVILVVVSFCAVGQYAAVSLMDPVKEQFDEGEHAADFNGNEFRDGIYGLVTKWMWYLLGGGIIAWGFAREYRRGRQANRVPGGRI
jgi:hypothetical protein